MALLSNGLLPASFRGAPFAVVNSANQGGRRIALHQFPGREDPWAEDMGRAARRWRFRGFICDGDVVFQGGPIQLQRLLLIGALEKKGSGTLTHPTQGVLTVAVESFEIGEDLGAGRMSSVDVVFVEAGKQTLPSLSKLADLVGAATLTTAALALDGVRLIARAASTGGTRSDMAAAANAFGSKIVTLGGDATALYRLAAQLPGQFGRFASGGNAGLSGTRTTGYTSATTLATLTATASATRATIASAATDLAHNVVIADLSAASSVPPAVSSAVQALAGACADPADAIRLLKALIAFQPLEEQSTMGAAIGGMMRRAACASLTIAVGDYQPSSSDDAARLIRDLGGILDDQATLAADAGDDATYKALRGARGAIIKDLRNRGGILSEVATFTFGRPLPSLVLAQQLYRDAARADQLVRQVDVPSPLFMPVNLTALAS